MAAAPPLWLVLPVLEWAGAERVVADLARRLPAHGFRPVVVCLEDEGAPLGRELSAAGVEVHGLHLNRRRTLACARALARRIELAAPGERPVLLHAHLFHANLAVRLAAARWPRQRAGAFPRVVCSMHVQEHRFRPWQFLMDRATARRCAVEICVSPCVERFHRERTGLSREFFRIIENGIDLERYQPPAAEERAALRARLGLSEGQLLVLAVGRLDEQKDHAALLEAWRLARQKRDFPDAVLWIAGEGPARTALEPHLPDGAKLLGFRTDVPDLYAACDLFVQPSAWEGLPLTVLEACACGCPVLASDIEPHRDIFGSLAGSPGEAGVMLPPGDRAAWARALTELLRSASRRAELGRAAAALARARFGMERMVADHARVYREVLAPK